MLRAHDRGGHDEQQAGATQRANEERDEPAARDEPDRVDHGVITQRDHPRQREARAFKRAAFMQQQREHGAGYE
jgi:hypothetical protein